MGIEILKRKITNGKNVIVIERNRYIHSLDKKLEKKRIMYLSVINGGLAVRKPILPEEKEFDYYIDCLDTNGIYIKKDNLRLEDGIVDFKYQSFARSKCLLKNVNGMVILEDNSTNYLCKYLTIRGHNLKGIQTDKTNINRGMFEEVVIERTEEDTIESELKISSNEFVINSIVVKHIKNIDILSANNEMVLIDVSKVIRAINSKFITIGDNETDDEVNISGIMAEKISLYQLVYSDVNIGLVLERNSGREVIIQDGETKNDNDYSCVKYRYLNIAKIEAEEVEILGIPNLELGEFSGTKLDITVNISQSQWEENIASRILTKLDMTKDRKGYLGILKCSHIWIKTGNNKDKNKNDNNLYRQSIYITINCEKDKFEDTAFWYMMNGESYERKHKNQIRAYKQAIKKYVKVEQGKGTLAMVCIRIKEKGGKVTKFAI